MNQLVASGLASGFCTKARRRASDSALRYVYVSGKRAHHFGDGVATRLAVPVVTGVTGSIDSRRAWRAWVTNQEAQSQRAGCQAPRAIRKTFFLHHLGNNGDTAAPPPRAGPEQFTRRRAECSEWLGSLAAEDPPRLLMVIALMYLLARKLITTGAAMASRVEAAPGDKPDSRLIH